MTVRSSTRTRERRRSGVWPHSSRQAARRTVRIPFAPANHILLTNILEGFLYDENH
jgi:hypothetical protein